MDSTAIRQDRQEAPIAYSLAITLDFAGKWVKILALDLHRLTLDYKGDNIEQ